PVQAGAQCLLPPSHCYSSWRQPYRPTPPGRSAITTPATTKKHSLNTKSFSPNHRVIHGCTTTRAPPHTTPTSTTGPSRNSEPLLPLLTSTFNNNPSTISAMRNIGSGNQPPIQR